LGRPPKETDSNKKELRERRKIQRQDEIDRISIEGKFGQAKRRFSLAKVCTKLKETSETAIAITFLVLNLEKLLQLLIFCLLYLFGGDQKTFVKQQIR